MRADRLISILLLLQSRGRMTARELARELEVSERTIYRDVEALSASGVPLYAEHGPGGGLDLLDSYRTNLTGLNEGELRALFMVSGAPGPLDRLGISRDLKSALLKLTAEMPDSQRINEEKVQQRFILDWAWWNHAQEPAPHLSTLQQAVWDDCRLRLTYQTYLNLPIILYVEPYGLVAKAGMWYLVAIINRSPRVYQVSGLIDVVVLEEHFERRVDFRLADFWRQWCSEYEQQQRGYLVRLRLSPGLIKLLPLYFGRRVSGLIKDAQPPDVEGWVTLTLAFESLDAARDRVLGLGSAAEVIEPEALRMSLMDYAAQICNVYARKG
ncbi:MAG: WYL domain-containing protein [Anaerolineaceae bacterium]|nr:WYL domain-containing protein [Anaerolineaceae bacterium]